MDAELSARAGNELLDNFAAIKKADVNLQTGLGERKGTFGINLIGDFNSADNFAVGWQLRAFGGEDSTKGANAGIFYRFIDDNRVYGVNVFTDYDDNDYGGFFRYGIGGEVQSQLFGLNVNY